MPKTAPARTRDLKRTRSEMLNAAFTEIFMNGFQGVSIDKIIARTGLTKGAFFHQFPTKMDLGYALVDEVLRDLIRTRWVEPLAEFDNPLEGIISQMNKLIGKASDSQLQLGCPLNNLVQEMTNVDRTFARKLSAVMDYWIDGIEAALKRGISNGYIRESVKTREAAIYIVMFHEGMYGFLKAQPDHKMFLSLFKVFKQQMDAYRA
ncbi:MAG: TetR/AcrR family transcriptional regulator [Steroidobacter sp.]